MDERYDISTASNSLLLDLDQRDWLAKLPVGQCICRYGTESAFLLKLEPMDDVKHAIISDSDVREHMQRDSRDSPARQDPSEELIEIPRSSSSVKNNNHKKKGGNTEEITQFLLGALEAPFAGVADQYGRYDSVKKAVALREQAEARGLVKGHSLSLPSGGRTVILELTQGGVELLRSAGYEARFPYFAGGPEHEFWKDRAAKHFTRKGYRVTKEHPIPDDGVVDVLAEREGERIAIEVETGKSDIEGNLRKLRRADISEIVIVPTSAQAERTVQKALTQVNVKARILRTSELWRGSPGISSGKRLGSGRQAERASMRY